MDGSNGKRNSMRNYFPLPHPGRGELFWDGGAFRAPIFPPHGQNLYAFMDGSILPHPGWRGEFPGDGSLSDSNNFSESPHTRGCLGTENN